MKLFVIAGAAGALMLAGFLPQDPAPRHVSPQENRDAPHVYTAPAMISHAVPSMVSGGGGVTVFGHGHRQPHDDKMHAAMNDAIRDYKDADDDSDRQAAVEKIREELNKQYDRFLEHQVEEIEQLEKRISELRDQIEKRRDAKSRMVDLKLEMVLSHADGLGWPEGPGGFRGAMSLGPTQLMSPGAPAFPAPERHPPRFDQPPPKADEPESPRRRRDEGRGGFGGGSDR